MKLSNSRAIILATIALSTGCIAQQESECSGVAFAQGESKSFMPPSGPVVQTLPDADATLSSDVDIYLITTKHTSWRTYTLPPCLAGESITIAKSEGHCAPEDTVTIEDQDEHVIFDITTESGIGCKGWGEAIAYDDDIGCKWIVARYGGAAAP